MRTSAIPEVVSSLMMTFELLLDDAEPGFLLGLLVRRHPTDEIGQGLLVLRRRLRRQRAAVPCISGETAPTDLTIHANSL